MLTLYHWEPSLNSGEPFACLLEKGIPFRSRYVDLLKLKQHEPKFLALNPDGQVPVLVHDGKIVTGMSIMLQYIDDAFPKKPLTPKNLAEQYQVFFWVKYVEERIAPSLALLGWHMFTRPAIKPAILAKARKTIKRLPPERQGVWTKAIRDSYSENDLAMARDVLKMAVGKLEDALDHWPWLAGQTYSLADIALVFMVRAMRNVIPDVINAKATPKLWAWLKKMERRKAIKDTLDTARTKEPDKTFAPGPEPARWG